MLTDFNLGAVPDVCIGEPGEAGPAGPMAAATSTGSHTKSLHITPEERERRNRTQSLAFPVSPIQICVLVPI